MNLPLETKLTPKPKALLQEIVELLQERMERSANPQCEAILSFTIMDLLLERGHPFTELAKQGYRTTAHEERIAQSRMRALIKNGLIERVNPEERKGAIYRLTYSPAITQKIVEPFEEQGIASTIEIAETALKRLAHHFQQADRNQDQDTLDKLYWSWLRTSGYVEDIDAFLRKKPAHKNTVVPTPDTPDAENI